MSPTGKVLKQWLEVGAGRRKIRSHTWHIESNPIPVIHTQQDVLKTGHTFFKDASIQVNICKHNNREIKSCIIFPLKGIMSYPCICLIACHIHGKMYRVASICFCISQRCTSHRTMYMTCYKTYTWIRHDSVKGEYDT